jgi:hypothetical protein
LGRGNSLWACWAEEGNTEKLKMKNEESGMRKGMQCGMSNYEYRMLNVEVKK